MRDGPALSLSFFTSFLPTLPQHTFTLTPSPPQWWWLINKPTEWGASFSSRHGPGCPCPWWHQQGHVFRLITIASRKTTDHKASQNKYILSLPLPLRIIIYFSISPYCYNVHNYEQIRFSLIFYKFALNDCCIQVSFICSMCVCVCILSVWVLIYLFFYTSGTLVLALHGSCYVYASWTCFVAGSQKVQGTILSCHVN